MFPVFVCNFTTALTLSNVYDRLTFVSSVTNHGVRFSTASLSVGKEGAIVALPCVCENSSSKVVEDASLKKKRDGKKAVISFRILSLSLSLSLSL